MRWRAQQKNGPRSMIERFDEEYIRPRTDQGRCEAPHILQRLEQASGIRSSGFREDDAGGLRSQPIQGTPRLERVVKSQGPGRTTAKRVGRFIGSRSLVPFRRKSF